jgi:hypothetical protein
MDTALGGIRACAQSVGDDCDLTRMLHICFGRLACAAMLDKNCEESSETAGPGVAEDISSSDIKAQGP